MVDAQKLEVRAFEGQRSGPQAGYLKVGDVIFADASEDIQGIGKSVEMNKIPDGGMIAGLHTISGKI